jgi:AcrR family transcriptional regulator
MSGAPGPRRRTPTQERSRDTVEAILTAATGLIVEQGITSLNTNAVARRAGVSITAVYAYFPDKWAIVHELSARFERIRGDFLASAFVDMMAAEDWRATLRTNWRALARFRVEVPGGLALRKALNATPELAAIDRAQSERAARGFVAVIRARRPDIAEDEAYRVSWAATIAAGVLIDDVCWTGEIDEAKFEAACELGCAYLAPYLDPPTRA